ncbi:hypothetical protein OUZ56_027808 [Daphnia magna]|uniref:Uncharacterized protein n=1 Tax=Daphnia magna TaxID=35525 RepID=A0ABR0B201_9CRUS|nr:hypothetical protein OUZ56_027808 [Daphnia magna]
MSFERLHKLYGEKHDSNGGMPWRWFRGVGLSTIPGVKRSDEHGVCLPSEVTSHVKHLEFHFMHHQSLDATICAFMFAKMLELCCGMCIRTFSRLLRLFSSDLVVTIAFTSTHESGPISTQAYCSDQKTYDEYVMDLYDGLKQLCGEEVLGL